jgi:hypothetical protein
LLQVHEAVFAEAFGQHSRKMPQILKLFNSHKNWLSLRSVFIKVLYSCYCYCDCDCDCYCYCYCCCYCYNYCNCDCYCFAPVFPAQLTAPPMLPWQVGLRCQYLHKSKSSLLQAVQGVLAGAATGGAVLRQPVEEASMAGRKGSVDAMANELLGSELASDAFEKDASNALRRKTVKVGSSEWSCGGDGSDPRWDAHNLLGYAMVCPLVPDHEVVNGPLFDKENALWEKQAVQWSEATIAKELRAEAAAARHPAAGKGGGGGMSGPPRSSSSMQQRAAQAAQMAPPSGGGDGGGWQPAFHEWQQMQMDVKELLEMMHAQANAQEDAQDITFTTAM